MSSGVSLGLENLSSRVTISPAQTRKQRLRDSLRSECSVKKSPAPTKETEKGVVCAREASEA